jgi:hypothetical protein
VEFMSKFCRCMLIVCIIVRWEGWSIEEAEEFGTKAVLGVWVYARWVKVPRVAQKEWICFGRTAVKRMLPGKAYVVDAKRTYHYCLAVPCETTGRCKGTIRRKVYCSVADHDATVSCLIHSADMEHCSCLYRKGVASELELATPSGCCNADWSGIIYRTHSCHLVLY